MNQELSEENMFLLFTQYDTSFIFVLNLHATKTLMLLTGGWFVGDCRYARETTISTFQVLRPIY